MLMKGLLGLLLGTSAMALDYKEIQKEIAQDKAVVIDVREPSEVKEGMLLSAKHIPLGQINSRATEIEKLGRGKKIYLYCRSGNRSQQAEELLKSKGIKASNIGGYEELKAKGL